MVSWLRGWALRRGHMIYSRGLIAVSLFSFVLIFFSSVLILFPFARYHICWCMQTCNVYMDSTIIFYFLFYKHAIFNQGDKSRAFLFSLAPFLFSLARWTMWEVGSIAWGGRRMNQGNCCTKTMSTLCSF